MTTEIQRNAVWDSLLEADYLHRYWIAKACDFFRLERTLQILLALSSSAALVTLLTDFGSDFLLKIFSLLTAVLATVQPFLNLTRRSNEMISMAGEWHQLKVEYDSMWRNLDEEVFSERKFKDLKSKEVEIGKRIGDLPINDSKLQKQAYKQVLIARGVAP